MRGGPAGWPLNFMEGKYGNIRANTLISLEKIGENNSIVPAQFEFYRSNPAESYLKL